MVRAKDPLNLAIDRDNQTETGLTADDLSSNNWSAMRNAQSANMILKQVLLFLSLHGIATDTGMQANIQFRTLGWKCDILDEIARQN